MFIIDFIFPKRCIICQVNGSYLCPSCFHSYFQINFSQKCHVCGNESREGMTHSECRGFSYLDGLIYVATYNKAAKKLIKLAKYEYVYASLKDVAVIMSQYILKNFRLDIDYLLDVPLSKSKFRLRGFNQSELLAKELSNKIGIKFLRVLNRLRNTKTQVGMLESERQVNLKGAFELRKGQIDKVKGSKVMIVDDVYTTGSTMNEIAKLLKANGVKEVFGFSFVKSRG